MGTVTFLTDFFAGKMVDLEDVLRQARCGKNCWVLGNDGQPHVRFEAYALRPCYCIEVSRSLPSLYESCRNACTLLIFVDIAIGYLRKSNYQ